MLDGCGGYRNRGHEGVRGRGGRTLLDDRDVLLGGNHLDSLSVRDAVNKFKQDCFQQQHGGRRTLTVLLSGDGSELASSGTGPTWGKIPEIGLMGGGLRAAEIVKPVVCAFLLSGRQDLQAQATPVKTGRS
jgi:hypothetical protein